MPSTSHWSTSVTSGASRGTSTTTPRSGRPGAGHGGPDEQLVGPRRQRREELRARQVPAVGVLLELRALDVGELAAGPRLAAHGRQQPAVGHDAGEQRARLLGRREPRQDPERVRVHLQELRRDAVDPREVVRAARSRAGSARPTTGPRRRTHPARSARAGRRRAAPRSSPRGRRRSSSSGTGTRAEAVGQRVDPAQSFGLLRGGHGVDRFRAPSHRRDCGPSASHRCRGTRAWSCRR